MKFKMIVAACAALCSATVMAAPLDPIGTAPQVTYYVGGASAQAQAVAAVVTDLFAAPADVVKITQTAGNKATGWYGMSNAALTGGTSVRLFVVYNNTNGSNAGVAQLLSTATPPVEAEAKVLSIGPGGDTLTGSGTSYTTASTANDKAIEIDMALSDVYPSEAVGGVLTPGAAGNLSFSALTIQTTALEGFGVVVNPALYQALQAQQGLTVGSLTAANQPNVLRADYASLISAEGAIKSAAQFFQNTDANGITLARRTDSSGTQAASNMYFLNNVCGTLGYQGALTPVGAFDANPGVFDILLETGTGAVKNDLSTGTATSVTGYGIGVISLENPAVATAASWQFVKLDGVSPNFNADGSVDTLQRNAFASGRYGFATEMTASYRNSANAISKALSTKMIAGLKDSTKHNLTGIAYLDGTAYSAGSKASRVNHGGNNCSPLRDTSY